MSHKKPPCLRGLKRFRSGCPESTWNGETGCPAWITRTVPTAKNPAHGETISQCLDMWMLTVNWDANKLLEGISQAIESFRNNMTESTEDGNYPKASRALRHIIGIFENELEKKKIISEYETQKRAALIDS
jgi:hypothetical protein